MIVAKLNREYALRVLGVGALMVGICGWSLYDGLRAWPDINRDLEAARPALLATNLTAEAWLLRNAEGKTELEALFASHSRRAPRKLARKLGELRLPDSLPDRDSARAAQIGQVAALFERPVYSRHDLRTQYVQALITLLLGLWACVVIAWRATKNFVADERGLHGSGVTGGPAAYADITSIDWSRWKEKGIVELVFKDQRRLKLDGWHYKGISDIAAELERQRPDLARTAKS